MTETHAPVGGQMEGTRTTTTVRYYPTRAVQASTFSNREDVREKFYAKCAGLRRQSNPAEAPVVLSVILLDRPVTSYRDTAMLWDDLDTGHKFIVRPDRRNPKKTVTTKHTVSLIYATDPAYLPDLGPAPVVNKRFAYRAWNNGVWSVKYLHRWVEIEDLKPVTGVPGKWYRWEYPNNQPLHTFPKKWRLAPKFSNLEREANTEDRGVRMIDVLFVEGGLTYLLGMLGDLIGEQNTFGVDPNDRLAMNIWHFLTLHVGWSWIEHLDKCYAEAHKDREPLHILRRLDLFEKAEQLLRDDYFAGSDDGDPIFGTKRGIEYRVKRYYDGYGPKGSKYERKPYFDDDPSPWATIGVAVESRSKARYVANNYLCPEGLARGRQDRDWEPTRGHLPNVLAKNPDAETEVVPTIYVKTEVTIIRPPEGDPFVEFEEISLESGKYRELQKAKPAEAEAFKRLAGGTHVTGDGWKCQLPSDAWPEVGLTTSEWAKWQKLADDGVFAGKERVCRKIEAREHKDGTVRPETWIPITDKNGNQKERHETGYEGRNGWVFFKPWPEMVPYTAWLLVKRALTQTEQARVALQENRWDMVLRDTPTDTPGPTLPTTAPDQRKRAFVLWKAVFREIEAVLDTACWYVGDPELPENEAVVRAIGNILEEVKSLEKLLIHSLWDKLGNEPAGARYKPYLDGPGVEEEYQEPPEPAVVPIPEHVTNKVSGEYVGYPETSYPDTTTEDQDAKDRADAQFASYGRRCEWYDLESEHPRMDRRIGGFDDRHLNKPRRRGRKKQKTGKLLVG